MNWVQVVEKLEAEFPDFKVVVKDESKLMRLFGALLKWFNPEFMERFTTTLGYTIYVPKNIIGTEGGADILLHEAVHLRDSKKWKLLYYLSYVILPIGPSFRAIWELRAYTESMQIEYNKFGYVTDNTIDFIASQFTGPGYLFMFPFPKTIDRILRKRAGKMKKTA